MDKLYPLLNKIDMAQAVGWLGSMTGTPLGAWDLLNLCDSGKCAVYLDCTGVDGHSMTSFDEIVNGVGFQKVLTPKLLIKTGAFAEEILGLSGNARVSGSSGYGNTKVLDGWLAKIQLRHLDPKFNPADIQALADAMNGTATQASELDRLKGIIAQHSAEKREMQRQMDIHDGVCQTAERHADDLMSQIRSDEMVECMRREALIDKHQAEMAELRREDSRSLDNRERASMERLIFILAKTAKYKLENLHSDEGSIQAAAALYGLKALKGKGSVVKHLKAAVARAERDQKEEREAEGRKTSGKA